MLMMQNQILQQERQEEKRNQEIEIQRKLLETLSVEKQDGRKTKCPTWDKNENISFFLERLKFWDSCENHKSKYLDLIKSLQESGRVQEKQRIENEIKN